VARLAHMAGRPGTETVGERGAVRATRRAGETADQFVERLLRIKNNALTAWAYELARSDSPGPG
jgi:hypothetical protein